MMGTGADGGAEAPATRHSPPSGRRWLALVTLAAFALRVWRLDGQGLWSDESISLERALLPLGAMLAELPVEHAPLYFVLLNLWLRVAGATDFALRFPSLWCGVAAVPLVAALARRTVGRRTALTAALLLAVNPLHVWHAQDARMYTLATCLALAALAALARALRTGAARDWAGYGLAGAEDHAERAYRDELRIARSIGHKGLRIQALTHLAGIHAARKEYDIAWACLDSCANGSAGDSAMVLVERARIRQLQGSADDAEALLLLIARRPLPADDLGDGGGEIGAQAGEDGRVDGQLCAGGHQHQPGGAIRVVQRDKLGDSPAHAVAQQHRARQPELVQQGDDGGRVGAEGGVPRPGAFAVAGQVWRNGVGLGHAPQLGGPVEMAAARAVNHERRRAVYRWVAVVGVPDAGLLLHRHSRLSLR